MHLKGILHNCAPCEMCIRDSWGHHCPQLLEHLLENGQDLGQQQKYHCGHHHQHHRGIGHRAFDGFFQIFFFGVIAVSYTHLDVYKRQGEDLSSVKRRCDSLEQAIVLFPFRRGDQPVSVSVSIGTAAFDPQTDTLSQFLDRVDRAMYQKKKQKKAVQL